MHCNGSLCGGVPLTQREVFGACIEPGAARGERQGTDCRTLVPLKPDELFTSHRVPLAGTAAYPPLDEGIRYYQIRCSLD